MKNLKIFENFNIKVSELDKIVMLDGTSSSGKSFISNKLKSKGWGVIAVDSFYAVLFKESDATSKYNSDMTLLDIYGKVWHENHIDHEAYVKIQDKNLFIDGVSERYPYSLFESVQYYMMKEIKEAEIWMHKLKDDEGLRVGRNPNSTSVIIDDIEPSCSLFTDYFGLPECVNILIYAPIDILKRNLIRRAKKGDMRGARVFTKHFLKRYYFSETKNGAIDDFVWTSENIREILEDEELYVSLFEGTINVDKFLENAGIKDDKKYWVKLKKEMNDRFKYKAIINTRDKEPQEILNEILKSL